MVSVLVSSWLFWLHSQKSFVLIARQNLNKGTAITTKDAQLISIPASIPHPITFRHFPHGLYANHLILASEIIARVRTSPNKPQALPADLLITEIHPQGYKSLIQTLRSGQRLLLISVLNSLSVSIYLMHTTQNGLVVGVPHSASKSFARIIQSTYSVLLE